MFFTSVLIVATAFGTLGWAQQLGPSTMNTLNLRYVDAQYTASGYGLPAMPNSLTTGFNLTSRGLLAVEYGDTVIENGQAYPASVVAAMPTVYITPQQGINPSYEFTLMMIDISAINNPDPQGVYRHYLAHSISPTENQTETMPANLTFVPTAGDVQTNYAGPGPSAGSGKHRYAWLLFTQGANFTAPAAGVAVNSPGYWNPVQYCAEVNCGVLVASTFFNVENAAPTFASSATSVINTATIVTSSSRSRTSSSPAASTRGIANAAAATAAATGGAERSVTSVALIIVLSILSALVI